MQQQKSVLHSSAGAAGGSSAVTPAGWRRALWLALLLAASVGFTLGLACALPFAALGAGAALTLPRRDALLLTGAAWLANQLVGFAILDYPWTANTLAWGVALGIVAALTTLAAQGLVRRLDGGGAIAAALASFLGAFAVYEGALFVVAATLLGGTEDFAPAIVARILAINAGAFIGLLILHRLGMAIGLAVGPAFRFAAAERHA
jgi:hypothetical protein